MPTTIPTIRATTTSADAVPLRVAGRLRQRGVVDRGQGEPDAEAGEGEHHGRRRGGRATPCPRSLITASPTAARARPPAATTPLPSRRSAQPPGERADRHGEEEAHEHQGGLGLARALHDVREQRHVDHDRDERHPHEQRDHERPDQPPAHQPTGHQWRGGAAVVHGIQTASRTADGQQGEAERAHDLGGRLGRPRR